MAKKLGRCPIETEIDVLDQQVRGDDHIGRVVLRQNRAVVADAPKAVSRANVIYEVEFTSHLIDTTCLNT